MRNRVEWKLEMSSISGLRKWQNGEGVEGL
jgi:hypothetical protein